MDGLFTMVRLLHFPLDPFCRRIRLTLSEMGLAAELIEERPWEAREDFITLNPAGTLPVMIDDDGTVAAGVEAAGPHLDETRPQGEIALWGTGPEQRAEVRRLVAWFDGKFHHEVTSPLLMEKVVKRFVPAAQGGGAPNMNRVRAAIAALKQHHARIAELEQALSTGTDSRQAERITELEAENEALKNQLEELQTQQTQQAQTEAAFEARLRALEAARP